MSPGCFAISKNGSALTHGAGTLPQLNAELTVLDKTAKSEEWSPVLHESFVVIVTRLKECCETAATVASSDFQLAISSLIQLFDADIPEAQSAALKRVILIVSRPARLVECVEFETQLKHDGPNGLPPPTIHRLTSSNLHLPRYLVDRVTNRFGRQRSDSEPPPSSAGESDSGIERGSGSKTSAAAPEPCGNGDSTGFDRTPRFLMELGEGEMPQRHDFEFTKLISSGAFGSVYLSRNKRSGEQVIKARPVSFRMLVCVCVRVRLRHEFDSREYCFLTSDGCVVGC